MFPRNVCCKKEIYIANQIYITLPSYPKYIHERHPIISAEKIDAILSLKEHEWQWFTRSFPPISGAIEWYVMKIPYDRRMSRGIMSHYFFVITDNIHVFESLRSIPTNIDIVDWLTTYRHAKYIVTCPVFTHDVMPHLNFTYASHYPMSIKDDIDPLLYMLEHNCYRMGDSKMLAMSLNKLNGSSEQWSTDTLLCAFQTVYATDNYIECFSNIEMHWMPFLNGIDLIMDHPHFYAFQYPSCEDRLIDFWTSKHGMPSQIIHMTPKYRGYATLMSSGLPHLSPRDFDRYLKNENMPYEFVSKRTGKNVLYGWDVMGVMKNILSTRAIYKRWKRDIAFRQETCHVLMHRNTSLLSFFNLIVPSLLALYKHEPTINPKKCMGMLKDILNIMDPDCRKSQAWLMTVMKYFLMSLQATPSFLQRTKELFSLVFQIPFLKSIYFSHLWYSDASCRSLFLQLLKCSQNAEMIIVYNVIEKNRFKHVRTMALLLRDHYEVGMCLQKYYRSQLHQWLF